jgi:hypothetical protein
MGPSSQTRRAATRCAWFAARALSGSTLRVRYRRVDEPSTTLVARTGALDNGNYGQPLSTMSQMSFLAGCWRITGLAGKVSLSFVVQVVLGGT